jgi:hypothetical protein
MPGIATDTDESPIPCSIRATADTAKNKMKLSMSEASPNVSVANAITSIPITTLFFLPNYSMYEPMQGAVTKKDRG